MTRIEDSRVMGNILRLMSKIMDEDKRKQEATALVLPPQPVTKKLFCKKMQMHVHVCRLASCNLYANCAGRHPSQP